MTDTYLTSYCNKLHRVTDGKPIGHECVILPPKALKLEIEGHHFEACELLAKSKLKHHMGVKPTITHDEFDEILEEIVDGMTAATILSYGDVYTTLAEALNNEVIELWEKRNGIES